LAADAVLGQCRKAAQHQQTISKKFMHN
jgi:hypothetical protein